MKTMKKLDIKKILIIAVIIIAVIVIGILIFSKVSKNDPLTKEQVQEYNNYVENYFIHLTSGQNTPYYGSEILYAKDETKLSDIADKYLITTAIKYLSTTGKGSQIDYNSLEYQYSDEYPEIKTSAIFSGEDIRAAIKTLFGIEDFSNPTIKGDITHLTTYQYLNQEDLYIVIKGNEEDIVSKDQFIDYSIIKTESKDNKLYTTVAIAYCKSNNETADYAADRNGTKVIAQNVKEFPTAKIDQFDKFQFTLTKSADGKNYIFESVKKVK